MTQDNSNRWYFIVLPIIVALIPVISNISTTIWLNSGINSIKKDIRSTENLKSKAELYNTIRPNVEVNLKPLMLNFSIYEEIQKNEVDKSKEAIEKLNKELTEKINEIDINGKITLNDLFENLKKIMEEYGINLTDKGNIADLIVLEIGYCVENLGKFTQFIHIPKIYIADRPKNEIDSYKFNKHELVPQNNPISSLIPKQKGCNVVKVKLGKELFQKIKNVPNERLNLTYKFELKIEPHLKSLMFLYENKEEAENVKKQLAFNHIAFNSTNSL